MDKLSELYRYLVLSSYRDGDYFLLEEYEELEDIIKRNDIARYLEDVRYQYLKGLISEEEYNDTCMGEINKLKLKK